MRDTLGRCSIQVQIPKHGLSSLKTHFKVYQKGEKHIDEIEFPAIKDILIVFQANLLNSAFLVDCVFPRDVNWGINSSLCSVE